MRLFHLLLVPLLGAPALAQTALARSDTPATTEHHGRRSAAQHFADANTTHDGRLTRDQAVAGYKSIAKSFDQIDSAHHGYVTMDDIKAWRAAKKAAHAAARRTAADASDSLGGVLRPIPAIDRETGYRPGDPSTDVIVPRAASFGRPRNGVDLPPAPLDRMRPS